MTVKRGVPTKSAKMLRVGRTVVIGGESLRITEIGEEDDPALGKLIVITCGERKFRRPPNAKIEVA